MKRITSRDVAKKAEVSQSLVSFILNNATDKKIRPETKARVLKVAKELGYQINYNAKNMKSSKASAIGLLSYWDASSFVFPSVVKGINSVCIKNDVGVYICSGKKNSSGNYDFVDYYLQNRIDGLLYISYVGVERKGIIAELEKAGIPFVCIIGARDIPNVSCVDVSFTESGYMAVKHLVSKGYKRIAYIPDAEFETMNYAEKERIAGSQKAAAEHGVQLNVGVPIQYEGKLKNLVIEEFFQKLTYDSVISTSLNCFGILKGAAQKGIKVPEQLGVISLDNEIFAPYLYPSLTTVDEPLEEIARMSTSILMDKIINNTICMKTEISPGLSQRESTAIELSP